MLPWSRFTAPLVYSSYRVKCRGGAGRGGAGGGGGCCGNTGLLYSGFSFQMLLSPAAVPRAVTQASSSRGRLRTWDGSPATRGSLRGGWVAEWGILVLFHSTQSGKRIVQDSVSTNKGREGWPSSNKVAKDKWDCPPATLKATLGFQGRWTCAHRCLGKLQNGSSKPRQGSTWISRWVCSFSSHQPFLMTHLSVTWLGASIQSLSSLLCPLSSPSPLRRSPWFSADLVL